MHDILIMNILYVQVTCRFRVAADCGDVKAVNFEPSGLFTGSGHMRSFNSCLGLTFYR